jgi:hypothetical protein
MTPKSFVYLAAAAVLSALLAIVAFAANNPWGSGVTVSERLMPTLASSIGKVAEIAVRQGEDTAVLERAGGSWVLKSKGGYPVDVAKVRTLLVGLGEAELVEGKTSRPDKYAALELEDPAQKGTKARLVKLTDAKAAPSPRPCWARSAWSPTAAARPAAPTCAGRATRKPGSPTWSSTRRSPPRTG